MTAMNDFRVQRQSFQLGPKIIQLYRKNCIYIDTYIQERRKKGRKGGGKKEKRKGGREGWRVEEVTNKNNYYICFQ